jgi:hypothetical protein
MRRIASFVAALVALATATGCFNPFSPRVLSERVTSTAPSPTSPQNAIRRFEWCWVNRGVQEYKELFTDDYVFISAGTDSAGNPIRDIQARRDDEVQIAENMFIGSADRPPADNITLSFDRTLIPLPDPRPGKISKWHKTILTSVALTVRVDANNSVEVTGYARFFLTRGDSAAIPAELKAQGFGPDSLRWWIDRWEDETIGSGAPQALRSPAPTGARATAGTAGAISPVAMSMAQLKSLYASRRSAAFTP